MRVRAEANLISPGHGSQRKRLIPSYLPPTYEHSFLINWQRLKKNQKVTSTNPPTSLCEHHSECYFMVYTQANYLLENRLQAKLNKYLRDAFRTEIGANVTRDLLWHIVMIIEQNTWLSSLDITENYIARGRPFQGVGRACRGSQARVLLLCSRVFQLQSEALINCLINKKILSNVNSSFGLHKS